MSLVITTKSLRRHILVRVSLTIAALHPLNLLCFKACWSSGYIIYSHQLTPVGRRVFKTSLESSGNTF